MFERFKCFRRCLECFNSNCAFSTAHVVQAKKSPHFPMLRGAENPQRIGLLPGEKNTRPLPTFKDGNYKINWLNAIIVLSPTFIVAFAIFVLQVPLDWRTLAA